MNITNDIVSFESKDVAQFSDAVQAALKGAAGEGRESEQILSDAVNAAVDAARRSRVNAVLESLRPTAEKIAGSLSDQDARLKIADIGDVAGVEDNHL